jgi:hypothetical protein
MIQLTHEEVQQVLAALQSLFGVPDKYTGLGGGAVAVWRLGGSAAPMDAISILKSKLTEPAPKPVSDFDIRGKLSTLKCWHRLSGDEVQDLIEFFGGSSAAPRPVTEPICGKNYAAGLWSRRNLEAYLEDQGC